MEAENPRKVRNLWKPLMVMAFLYIGLIIVIFKLFKVQIIEHDYYADKAKRQHESTVVLSASRGDIFDAKGRLLATDINTISVAVDPTLLKDQDKVCAILAADLEINKKILLQKIKKAKGSFVWLVRGALPHKVRNLMALNEKGLIFLNEKKRRYPYGSVGSHILGATDIDNRGITGLELGWDSALAGKNGYMILYRDAVRRLRPSIELPIIEAQDGNSIQLTIDADLQRIAEYELEKGVKEVIAESGTCIIIEVQTGKIAALATAPGFDPNNITKEAVNNMKLKAITDTYEPGSTFKMVTSAIAIEEKDYDEYDVFDGHMGVANFNGYSIRDVHGLGRATFKEAIENSSNIIFAEIGASIPSDKYYKYLRDFGFGLTHEFDLPGEVNGRLPKLKDFSVATKRFVGHGYAIAVTPLQLAVAYAAIANGGVVMRPYLVESVINHAGDTVYSAEPEKIRQVVSKRTSDRIARLFTGVVENGTGKRAKIEGFHIAGKTGTSKQVVNGYYGASYIGSFAGFFPAESPKYAMLVVINEPKGPYYGGSTAAPVFKNILSRWINLNPDLVDYKLQALNTNEPISDTVITPNLLGLNSIEAKSVAEASGLKLKSGFQNGLVTYQSPSPGMQALKGIEIEIQTQIQANPLHTLKREQPVKDTNLPDVRGLSLRKAIDILSQKKINFKIEGSGRIKRQEWGFRGGKRFCKLYCY